MKVEMVMPQMGESIAEGTIVKWIKSVGDRVELDEDILEISTDKVDSEIPTPATGVIAEILIQEGTTVPIGTVLALIETEGDVSVEKKEKLEHQFYHHLTLLIFFQRNLPLYLLVYLDLLREKTLKYTQLLNLTLLTLLLQLLPLLIFSY